MYRLLCLAIEYIFVLKIIGEIYLHRLLGFEVLTFIYFDGNCFCASIFFCCCSLSSAGVLIRRKKSDPNPLQQVFVPPILSAQTPTKFIIEVANSMYFVCVFVSKHFSVRLNTANCYVCVVFLFLQVAPFASMLKVTKSNQLPVFLIRLFFPSIMSVSVHMTI